MYRRRRLQFIFLFFCAVNLSFFGICFPAFSFNNPLQKLIAAAVEDHGQVKAAQAEVDAAIERRKASGKDWYPTLNLKAATGHEKRSRTKTATSQKFRDVNLSLRQQLWDFGSTKAKMNKAGLALQKKELQLLAKRQEIILKALSAILEFSKTSHILKFAEKSEKNIQKQTGLEEVMVRAGSGYTTDVLQAKTQLSGAIARRIQAQLGVNNALSRYRIIFPHARHPPQQQNRLVIPERYLPSSLSIAEQVAKENNALLLLSHFDAQIAKETIAQTKAEEFAPKLAFKLEQKWKYNVGGVEGKQDEIIGKIEFNMPLNLGLTGFNEVTASYHEESAALYRVNDTMTEMLAKVRQAWFQFSASRKIYNARKEQATLAKAFLRLARKERKLGTRSLIDVLSGETSLINAQSDSAAAQADLIISSYALLAAIGTLKISHIMIH